MKLLLVIAVGCLAVSANAASLGKNNSRINGENGWYVPQANNTFQWMDKEEFESYQESMANSKGLTLTPVKYFLFTRNNPSKSNQLTDSAKTIMKSNFNPNRPTKFVTHGFLQSHLSAMNKRIRKALLKKEDCNVIIIDWARARGVEYISSVMAVQAVAEKLGHMIKTLMLHGMSLNNTTLIGHSLGAHISGIAAKYLQPARPAVIYGLDPALPLFSFDKPHKRLSREDANYVESIQTNAGAFGFMLPIGTASFYPNGGEGQPGCLTSICSHERSISYFVESMLDDNFAAIVCENLQSAVANRCGETFSSVRMGAEMNPFAVSGIYNVPVNKKTPFGMLH